MKIEALIRILQYCEDNNIEIDYGTKENISTGKRYVVRCISSSDPHYFTKGRLYIGTIKGSDIEIEKDDDGYPHSMHVLNFNIIKEWVEHQENLNISDVRSNNYMMIDVDWIDSSIQNYIELKQKINKDGNNPIMTQDYNAKIRILKEVMKQLKPII